MALYLAGTVNYLSEGSAHDLHACLRDEVRMIYRNGSAHWLVANPVQPGQVEFIVNDGETVHTIGESLAARQAAAEAERRRGLFAAMEKSSNPDACRTMIHGYRLGDMDDREIRIAAHWLATMWNSIGRSNF